ncbi:MAG: DUF1840 domain-containing protein [Rubrivivax sp.]|jgi:hypothetical protein|nr:DUF1840 domain-containing protein [Rubrivivax sp.]
MIYKFKSKATGDLIMLGPNGDQLLRLLGREPAPKGIIEPADMPAARQRLEAALADAEAAAAQAGADGQPDDERTREAVGLRQRVWPMLQMLERAAAAREAIVWGV